MHRKDRSWMFCLPALLILFFVAAYPLARTAYLSLTDARLSSLDSPHWIGIENYQYLFLDQDWWRAAFNTAVFALISVSFETILGILIAVLLNTEFYGRSMLRAAVLVPWVIPSVVSAKIWAWMFNDLYGVINHVLLKLRIIPHPIAWLADDRLALLTVVAVDVWKTTPFMTLLILAALQSLPKNIYESARIEGASAIQQFFRLTLPLIKPAILVAVIFRTLDALRVFDLPFVLTSNSKATAVMSVYARQQMVDFQDVGFGSSASVVIFFVIALTAIVYLYFGRESLGLKK